MKKNIKRIILTRSVPMNEFLFILNKIEEDFKGVEIILLLQESIRDESALADKYRVLFVPDGMLRFNCLSKEMLKSVRDEQADMFVISLRNKYLNTYKEYFRLALYSNAPAIFTVTNQLHVSKLSRRKVRFKLFGDTVKMLVRFLSKRKSIDNEKIESSRIKAETEKRGLDIAYNNIRLIKDDDFVFKGNPIYPEHDARGYRNRTSLKKTDSVVVGDSQFYGTGVERDLAWPNLMESLYKDKIYNVSCGGWGVLHYALAVDEVLPLMPNKLFVGVYLGNDICESYLYARLSQSSFAKSVWKDEYSGLPKVKYGTNLDADLDELVSSSGGISNVKWETALKVGSDNNIKDCNRYEIGPAQFYLQDDFRFNVQDLQHPTIQAGLEISKKSLEHIGHIANNYGIDLTVLIMPTREYVAYTRRSDANVSNETSLIKLGENEKNMHLKIEAFCKEKSIRTHNLTKVLSQNIEKPIYFQNSVDGHLSEYGHKLIARHIKDIFYREDESLVSSKMYPLY